MTVTGRVIQMEDAAGFPVAVKRWNKENSDKAVWEQKLLMLMDGEGAPRFVRYFEDAESVYLATEWINGVTLDDYVEEAGGSVSIHEALHIGEQILKILQRLHHSREGRLVYTDLKPSNVMIKDGKIYLVDMESVRFAHSEEGFYDEGTVVMGTRPFTAPEVFTGRTGPESDYYSLGAIMFYMLTGQLWFGNSDMLAGIEGGGSILMLMNPDPSQRSRGLEIFSREHLTDINNFKGVRVADSNISINEPRVIFIHNNPRFAVEMAYNAAAHMDIKVGIFTMEEQESRMLVKVLNRDMSCDRHYSIETEEDGVREFFNNADLQQWLRAGYIIRSNVCSNLFSALIQPSQMYRLLPKEEWSLFVKSVKRIFDMTVISGRLMDDYISLLCDTAVAAVTPNVWETSQAVTETAEFQNIAGAGHVRFAAWEYKDGVSMSIEKFMNDTNRDYYIGEIYYDSNRHIIENLQQLPYCFSMPEIIKQQYQRIIAKLLYK